MRSQAAQQSKSISWYRNELSTSRTITSTGAVKTDTPSLCGADSCGPRHGSWRRPNIAPPQQFRLHLRGAPMVELWRRGWDSNPRTACTVNGFRDRPDRPLRHLSKVYGGEGGIRTLGRVTPTHAFQACSIGHSDTSPHHSATGIIASIPETLAPPSCDGALSKILFPAYALRPAKKSLKTRLQVVSRTPLLTSSR